MAIRSTTSHLLRSRSGSKKIYLGRTINERSDTTTDRSVKPVLCSVKGLCRVPHSVKGPRQTNDLQRNLCRVPDIGHSIKTLCQRSSRRIKDVVMAAGTVTTPFAECRVIWHSTSSLIIFLINLFVECRVSWHLAKSSFFLNKYLPSAWCGGTQQRPGNFAECCNHGTRQSRKLWVTIFLALFFSTFCIPIQTNIAFK